MYEEIPESDVAATYKDLAAVYVNKLMFYYNLKNDSIHKKIIETKEKCKEEFKEEGHTGKAKALQSAVSERKFMLKEVFDK